MNNTAFDAENEWRKANKGAWKRRAPFFVGLGSGALLAGIAFAVFVFLADSQQQEIDRVHANGGTIVCRHIGRGGTRTTQGPCESSPLFALVVVGGLALVGFAGGFLASGGKLSAEHIRGLSDAAQR
jgi:hypothetical protein